MRTFISFISTLALCVAPVRGLAQPVDDTLRFNRPLSITDCVGQVPDSLPYPFSVSRITNAIDPSQPLSNRVNVLIVDNNFYGYRENDDPTGRRLRVSSKNYPDEFFKRDSNDNISPEIDDSNAGTFVPTGVDPEIRHGTHIAGIVLGGMYDDETNPAEDSLKEPNARTLLLDETRTKSWLQISFLTIQYGSGAAADDPVSKINNLADLVNQKAIVNMSLGKALASTDPRPRLRVAGPLIVASAGNGGRKLSRSAGGLDAIPATMSEEYVGRILVVASHDANGELSGFSNYFKFANIAAPGCKIKSWIDGEHGAVPLSGTSMATAIVTFAAALVRSRWILDDNPNPAVAVRNRLLASARYVPNLEKCPKLSPAERIDPLSFCVKDGAMLDIEAAVNITRDLIEFEDCVAPQAQDCPTKIGVGDLEFLPPVVSDCLTDDIPQGVADHGISRNGAVKRVARDRLLLAYESGSDIGAEALRTEPCPFDPNADAAIKFKIYGKQLDGRDVPETDAETLVPLRNLKRLVMRVTRRPGS